MKMYLNKKFILENVALVSEMLLTVECLITEVKSAEPSMPIGSGLPGMYNNVIVKFSLSQQFWKTILS